jgi:hypothetical protein
MKVLDNVKAVATGNRRYIDQPLHSISYCIDSAQYHTAFAKEYSITITLGASQWIAEDIIVASKGAVVNEAISAIKRAIVEELYGELRRDLLNLHMQLRNELNYYDSDSLKTLVSIIESVSL